MGQQIALILSDLGLQLSAEERTAVRNFVQFHGIPTATLSHPAPGSRGGPLSAFNKIRIGRIHIVYDIFTWVPQRFSDAREGLYPEIEHLASPSPRTII